MKDYKKSEKEGKKVKFQCQSDDDYNQHFLITKLQVFLNKVHDKATGPDDSLPIPKAVT